MTDIFDTKILCNKCGIEMKKGIIEKNGAQLRAVVCPKCGDKIVHPADLNCLNRFNDLKDKKFNVKLRMVGNSHAISIPKEIFEFMEEQHRVMNEGHRRMRTEMDEMVRLAFEDFGRLSLDFFGDEEDEEMEENGRSSRVVKSSEVRVVKNGKNLLHTKQTYDSAHPERNKREIIEEESNEEE
jgi:virulence-associated protein VagC/DNA-directed RNA polymerase subunit RPC12/RpoP